MRHYAKRILISKPYTHVVADMFNPHLDTTPQEQAQTFWQSVNLLPYEAERVSLNTACALYKKYCSEPLYYDPRKGEERVLHAMARTCTGDEPSRTLNDTAGNPFVKQPKQPVLPYLSLLEYHYFMAYRWYVAEMGTSDVQVNEFIDWCNKRYDDGLMGVIYSGTNGRCLDSTIRANHSKEDWGKYSHQQLKAMANVVASIYTIADSIDVSQNDSLSTVSYVPPESVNWQRCFRDRNFPYNPFSNKRRKKTTIANIFNKYMDYLAKYGITEFTISLGTLKEIEDYVIASKMNNGIREFEVVPQDEVVGYYESFDIIAGLDSCMTKSETYEYSEFYAINYPTVRLVIGKQDGRVVERALVWEIEGGLFLDRIYTRKRMFDRKKVLNSMIEEGTLFIDGKKVVDTIKTNGYGNGTISGKDYVFKMKKPGSEMLPYIDTWQRFHYDGELVWISNNGDELNSPVRDATSADGTSLINECEYCGASIDFYTDEVYDNDYGAYCCTECAIYCSDCGSNSHPSSYSGRNHTTVITSANGHIRQDICPDCLETGDYFTDEITGEWCAGQLLWADDVFNNPRQRNMISVASFNEDKVGYCEKTQARYLIDNFTTIEVFVKEKQTECWCLELVDESDYVEVDGAYYESSYYETLIFEVNENETN